MDRELWIKERAKFLWEEAGKPVGKDLDFWFNAEKEYCLHICVLSKPNCGCNITLPSIGGRYQNFCTAPWIKCGFHASDNLN